MSSEILFVTSYTKELYAASGRRLLESFRVVKQPGAMLACTEGFKRPEKAFEGKPYIYHNLDDDPFLGRWLMENKDVIPDHLGGDTKMCDCPGANERHGREHKTGCHWHWMNRNASRWFRKVASLRQGVRVADALGTPWMVWLDADDHFIRPLPLDYLKEKLRDVALFHFRGHREATESGILGIQLAQGGREFVAALCERYTSKDYRKYERWDDGYQISRLVLEGKVKARDLVHPTKYKSGDLRTEDVIPTTDIKKFLVHDKGRHGQYLGLMK